MTPGNASSLGPDAISRDPNPMGVQPGPLPLASVSRSFAHDSHGILDGEHRVAEQAIEPLRLGMGPRLASAVVVMRQGETDLKVAIREVRLLLRPERFGLGAELCNYRFSPIISNARFSTNRQSTFSGKQLVFTASTIFERSSFASLCSSSNVIAPSRTAFSSVASDRRT
jgi:hypothetical protein